MQSELTRIRYEIKSSNFSADRQNSATYRLDYYSCNIRHLSYIRQLSYCFYIAVTRICVAISRVDGALKPWSAIHLGVGNSKQKPAYLDVPGCSSYVKSASAVGAEEIITMIQRPKWRCSSMLWSMESMTRHKRNHGHPLHPGLAPDVLTLSCLWIQLGQDERVRLTLRASPSL